MSAKTEKQNIAKIKEKVEQIDKLNKQRTALQQEIEKLFMKRYPSSDRNHISIFKSKLEIAMLHPPHLDEVKSMLEEDKIVYKSGHDDN